MKLLKMSLLRRVLKDEQGQTLVFVSLGMLAFLLVSGLSMDLVNIYAARQALQASTNSAALSGAVYISGYDTTGATAAVTQYSSMSGNLNPASNLTNVTLADPTFVCLNTVKSFGIPCKGATGSIPAGFNAMIVKQEADVNLWFGKLLGKTSLHLTAIATSSPGSQPQPLNLAIIVDSTPSMGTSVTGVAATADPQCANKSEMLCALNGVGILLSSLPSPEDAPAALFTFPNVQANTAINDINGGTVNQMLNSTPTLGTSYAPTGTSATYEIVAFTTDYTQITKAVGTVNSSTGATTTTGKLNTPSGGVTAGTYLAGAIVAAQSALVAENVVHPVALGQNVIVILTDGNVNGSDQYQYAGGASTMAAPTSSTWDVPTSPATTVTYPSGVAGCGQAVEMAQAVRASSLQTSIFVVAYGSPTTSSWNPSKVPITGSNVQNMWINGYCPADSTQFFTDFVKTKYGKLPTSTNVSKQPNISPCTTAQKMASPNKAATSTTNAIIYFYSDDMGASSGCPSDAPPGSLSSIFQSIAGSIPRPPRLIPNGST